MKKLTFFLAFTLIGASLFASEKQPLKEKKLSGKSLKNSTVCETRSGTIYSGPNSVKVTCTMCDEDPGVAAALAANCANGGPKKLISYL